MLNAVLSSVGISWVFIVRDILYSKITSCRCRPLHLFASVDAAVGVAVRDYRCLMLLTLCCFIVACAILFFFPFMSKQNIFIKCANGMCGHGKTNVESATTARTTTTTTMTTTIIAIPMHYNHINENLHRNAANKIRNICGD